MVNTEGYLEKLRYYLWHPSQLVKHNKNQQQQQQKKQQIWDRLTLNIKVSSQIRLNKSFVYIQYRLKGPKACNFIKKRLQHMCFSVKFANILTTPFSTEHNRRLYLKNNDTLMVFVTARKINWITFIMSLLWVD